jgi:hypothetical protein
MREYMAGAFDGLNPFTSFEEMSKQQLAMFERAVKMFSPFYPDETPGDDKPAATQSTPADKQIEELRARLNEMQRQLDEFVSRGDDRAPAAAARPKEAAPGAKVGEAPSEDAAGDASRPVAKRSRVGGSQA